MVLLNLKDIKINFQTNKLTKKDHLNKIFELKDQYWEYGLSSQRKWHNKNIKSSDTNFFVTSKNKTLFYLLSRKIKCEINNKKFNFNTLDFVCIDKSLIGKKISNIFVEFFFILNNKDQYIITCNKKLCKYYSKFDFRKINKTLTNYKGQQIVMIKGYKNKIKNIKINYLL
tara:strand:- start:8768 stop:9280 length:513 start_codon:yes stop_codon:yes gene_type:complete